MKIGKNQAASLKAMARHNGEWYEGCGWIWTNHSSTRRLMEGLRGKGFVAFTTEPRERYVMTRAGYLAIDMAPPPDPDPQPQELPAEAVKPLLEEPPRLSIRTIIEFAEHDFDRVLEASYPSGLRIINPENGVGRAKRIWLEITLSSVMVRMSYYPINVDGSEARSIRFWHEELPRLNAQPGRDVLALIGPGAPHPVRVALTTMGFGGQDQNESE